MRLGYFYWLRMYRLLGSTLEMDFTSSADIPALFKRLTLALCFSKNARTLSTDIVRSLPFFRTVPIPRLSFPRPQAFPTWAELLKPSADLLNLQRLEGTESVTSGYSKSRDSCDLIEFPDRQAKALASRLLILNYCDSSTNSFLSGVYS